MKYVWQLQEAKNKFSEVVEEAISQGPQIITRRGVEAVIVMSYADYRKLVASQKKFSEFFRQSPLTEEIDLRRDRSDVRPDITI
jgi:prevent-host-death family protein